ncbi:MAG: dockerin type I repeat-containing protein, partial [Acutalibacteraceae bacterium]
MKKILSVIMALVMLVSLSAVSAFAAVTDAVVEAADGSELKLWDDIGYITGVTPETVQENFLAQLVPSNCELSLDCSSTYVGTGAVVNLVSDDSTVIKSYTIVLYGDLDCNGRIDPDDVYDLSVIDVIKNNYEVIINQKEGYLRSDLSDAVWAAADCNHDGMIDQYDRDLASDCSVEKAAIDQTVKPEFNAVVFVYRDELKAAIETFESIDFSPYSTIGVKYALKYYNKAVEVYNNPDASQSKIDNAESALTSAISTAKSVLKTAEPSIGVLSGYIKATNDVGDNAYYKWDKNLGILTLYPNSEGIIDVPLSTVTQLGYRPTPWARSIFVTTVVVTAPVTSWEDNTYIHTLYNFESVVFTDPNTKIYPDFIENCKNSNGKTITVYGCNDNHEKVAGQWGFDYKSVDEYSVSAETGSGITLDSESKTVTGVGVGKSTTDLLSYDVALGGNCYVELDSDVVGTGSKLIAKSVIDGSTLDEYDVIVYGDVDGDGVYDATDAYKVNLIINGWLTREQVGEAAWAAADCNHDGVIDSL